MYQVHLRLVLLILIVCTCTSRKYNSFGNTVLEFGTQAGDTGTMSVRESPQLGEPRAGK